MPQRTVPLIANEYYHVYNRGNNRQLVFLERANYIFFLRCMRKYLLGFDQTSEVSETSDVCTTIVAYCLMPNHFHFLIYPHRDDLSRRMRRLSISYTKAMNKRYNRVGALFLGQFQAVHVDRNEYLLHLSRHIHLNPVAAGLVRNPEDWEFSSYLEYLGLRAGALPTPETILLQFPTSEGYREFVQTYSLHDRQIIAHLLCEDDG
jgi:putative transposase